MNGILKQNPLQVIHDGDLRSHTCASFDGSYVHSCMRWKPTLEIRSWCASKLYGMFEPVVLRSRHAKSIYMYRVHAHIETLHLVEVPRLHV